MTDDTRLLRNDQKTCEMKLGSPPISFILVAILLWVVPVLFTSAQEDRSAEIEAYIERLRDENAEIRKEAALALGKIGRAAELAVPALVEALKENAGNLAVRSRVADALWQIGGAAAPALVEALAHEDSEVRNSAIYALWRIGPAANAAVPALIKVLGEDEEARNRNSAADALGMIGAAASPAVPALIEALKDDDIRVRASAASALARIGPTAEAESAVAALITVLKDKEAQVRSRVADALRQFGPAGTSAASPLIQMLKDDDVRVRASAARALGRIRPDAELAVPALIEALKDKEKLVLHAVAESLADIAVVIQESGAPDAIDLLQRANDALQSFDEPEIRQNLVTIATAIKHLELLSWRNRIEHLFELTRRHMLASATASIVLLWAMICFALFVFRPLTVLSLNDFLRPADIKLPAWLGEISISMRYLLLVGFLNYRPRVLDAWVAHHADTAKENFIKYKRTVVERLVHISLPVELDREVIPELKGVYLRKVFDPSGPGRLLISGEGGSGKTSLACQIARWGMSDVPHERPAPHRMLPVLIERELDFEAGRDKNHFTEAVRGDLAKLIGTPVAEDLFQVLLTMRRVLVIVDHLSEMSRATQQRVRPDVPDFPSSALIVTSRLEERLGDVPKSVLKPLRVTGDYLFEFMGAYLRAQGVREWFPDREFGRAGARIAELVGERTVTVLLVKLYLDRLIETKQREGDVDKELPRSIPSLILKYLNDINLAVAEDAPRRDARAVHQDAKAVAWACVEERFLPAAASIDQNVRPALAIIDPEEVDKRLDYLEHRLRLIETLEPERKRIRFLLDPVAEYLAGFYLIEHYNGNANQWQAFLARADEMPGSHEALQGFLLAVRDCGAAEQAEAATPDFVLDEIAKRFTHVVTASGEHVVHA